MRARLLFEREDIRRLFTSPGFAAHKRQKKVISAGKIAVICILSMTIVVIVDQQSACRICVHAADDALSDVVGAENAAVETFAAIVEADNSGANVSALLTRLNGANTLVAEARNALRRGDKANTSLLANQAINVMEGIVEDAVTLERNAESERQSRLVWTVSLSSVGLGILVVVGLFCWRYVTKRYSRRVIGMKPETVSNI